MRCIPPNSVIFSMEPVPLGCVMLPIAVRCLRWLPHKFGSETATEYDGLVTGFTSALQGRSWAVRTGGAARRAAVKLQRRLRDNERLLVVAVSSMLMSASHTALRPVLPLFAKVRERHAHAATMRVARMQLHAGLSGSAIPVCMRHASQCPPCCRRPSMLARQGRAAAEPATEAEIAGSLSAVMHPTCIGRIHISCTTTPTGSGRATTAELWRGRSSSGHHAVRIRAGAAVHEHSVRHPRRQPRPQATPGVGPRHHGAG